jgi:hypothetical protein
MLFCAIHWYSPPSSSLIFEMFTCEITSSCTVTYWPIKNRELSGIYMMIKQNQGFCSIKIEKYLPEIRPISKRIVVVDGRLRRI